MIITDKQELRRCVKQAVRRAQVAETLLRLKKTPRAVDPVFTASKFFAAHHWRTSSSSQLMSIHFSGCMPPSGL